MKILLRRELVAPVCLWVIFCGIIAAFMLSNNGSQILIREYPLSALGFIAISLLALAYLIYVIAYAAFYRSLPSWNDERLPGCTIIVPAYNEGEHVRRTLISLLNSDYPAEKMEIIAIDDGSLDDTASWIMQVVEEFPGRVKAVKMGVNGGKKKALCRGFELAKNEIVVTVDSDSLVPKSSLRNLVSGFSSPEIGAVAGNIRVDNLDDGIIPRMMDISFMFGFEVIRSAQSLIGFVMCTPGALSGYRRSVVLPLLDAWQKQTFLGVPAKIGEDRAIATMILKSGYQVTYQKSAVAFTRIPHTYRKLCMMLLRWVRSDIRENYLMQLYCFKLYPLLSWRTIGLQIHLFAQIMNTVMPALFLPILIVTAVILTLSGFALSIYSGVVLGLVSAFIPGAIYAKRVSVLQSVWALFFSIYSVFALSWICLYAFFTLRNTSWLTRDLPKSADRCEGANDSSSLHPVQR